MKLPGNMYPGISRPRHFQKANEMLHKKMQSDPAFARMMEKLHPGITEGVKPGAKGAYPRRPPTNDTTWHHHPTVSFRYNPLNDVILLMQSIPDSIVELSLVSSLSDIDDKDDDISMILASLPASLQQLNLKQNRFGYCPTDKLIELFSNLPLGLKKIDFTYNNLGVKTTAELKDIFTSLSKHQNKPVLVFDSAGLDDEKIQLLGNMGFELEIKQTSPNSGQGLKSHAP